MTDKSKSQVKQLLAAAVAIFLIPLALMALQILTALEKLWQQGWKYFIPTWSGLADLVSLAGLIAFFAVATLMFHLGYNPYVASVPSLGVMLASIFLAAEVHKMEDRTGRKKVFKFAEVENCG